MDRKPSPESSAARAAANLLFEEAHCLLSRMQTAEALALFEQAEQLDVDADSCAAGRWTCHMLHGHFDKAWGESDAICARGNPDRHRFWDGQPLGGKRVLIRCLHGLGDTIQFIRFAPLLREVAAYVTVEAQPPLRRLLAASSLADRVIAWNDDEGPWDSQVEVVELPRIFRIDNGSIPCRVPYLQTAASMTTRPTPSTSPLRVGVLWRAGNHDPNRSVPAAQMAKLFEIEGIRFFNLQTGPEQADLSAWQHIVPMLHEDGEDVFGTATKLQNVDLVITVDTMLAHLAGALAKPVWTLLPHQCDWRWMLARSDSPWYPTMRLIRQNEPADWSAVIATLQQDLRRLAAFGGNLSLKPASLLTPDLAT